MSIWKKLKRLLRSRKGLIALAVILLCLTVYAVMLTGTDDETQQVMSNNETLEVISYEQLFFGLSAEGVLTLYHGLPEENQVIETFFRIDTELLKSELPESELQKLKTGIRVYNAEDYEAVLATFKPFAAEY
ncbi:BofC C-terminal domain-containing protein [Caldalkalibacillus thermarum TA2.A1]|uniref:BofC C-terminal domain-containing protein n=1 Tax=Caldalkalibacillus thermarum (strain TA2.A1) TaxID=986075 RepID=A0A8X8I3V5_CALTT|nr:BofC C-terminal domain-containing protein [Caldalkalibacillus thermarum]QZT33492.1 BofC C-terminal domain-containing protein [Caldalkalibacillus thermarum TA2.A1]